MTAASPAPADLDDLLLALGSAAGAGRDRSGAMAEFLSGSEGWRGARAALGGAFADAAGSGATRSGMETGLMPGKDR